MKSIDLIDPDGQLPNSKDTGFLPAVPPCRKDCGQDRVEWIAMGQKDIGKLDKAISS